MCKVLVADDSKIMRKVISDMLGRNGYDNVIEAEGGSKAVELYKSERPDIVILDWSMSHKSGLSALIEIVDYDVDALVIVCSEESTKIQVYEALSNGCKGYILKPFTEQVLIENVERVLGMKKKQE